MNYNLIIKNRYLVINTIVLILGAISNLLGFGFKLDVILYVISSTILFKYVLIPNIEEFSKSFFRGVKNGLHEIAVANVSGFNLRQVALNFGNHYAGITACFYSAINNPSTSVVVAELVKIGSFLGIEIPIVNVITSKAAQIVSDQLREETLEDCIPLIGTAAALTGQEISGISVDSFLQKQARNITNIKVVQEQVRTVMETAGIIAPKNHEKIMEISNLLLLIRDDFEHFTKLMAVAGHDLNKPEGRKRLKIFEQRVKDLNALIKTVNQPSLKNNAVFTEASNLINLALKILVQAKIVQSQKMRPTPVGVCLQGVSGIGKSTLTTALINAVKREITENYIESLGSADDWQTWFAQFRDDFDTGYNGQEITYMDDAFQKKDNSDHPMWINFISNQPIGMVMAREEEKGKPFNSLMCLVTCNVIPKSSTTIWDISALHNRFPITVVVGLKDGRRLPSPNDPLDLAFSHMKFKMGRMTEVVGESDKVKEVTFSEIVKTIAMAIHNNNEKCVKILNSDLNHYQSSDESDYDDDVVVFDPAKVTGQEQEPTFGEDDDDAESNQSEPRLPLIPEDSEDDESSDYDTFERTCQQVKPGTAYRHCQQVRDAKAGDNWEIDRLIGESILRAFEAQPIKNIRALGPWIFKLKRKSDGKMLKEVFHEYRDMPTADFLRAFAIWSIPQDEETNFMLSKIPALKVVDTYETEYIWSPSLMGGEFLFGAFDGFKQEVIERMRPWYIRKISEFKRGAIASVSLIWNGETTRRALIRYAVAVTGTVFLPVPSITGYFEQQAIYSAIPFWTERVANASNEVWWIRFNPWLRADYWVRRRVESAYNRLEEALKIVKDTTVSLVIQVCELLGIDTTGMIQNFASVVGDIVLHATILSIFTILLYLLYKLLMSFSQEPIKAEGEYDKERFRRKAKKEKKSIRRLRHETEGLLCKDCTKQTSMDILGESFEYYHDKGCNNLYEAEFIDLIEEYIDDDKTYVGAIYQNQGECSLINVYSAENDLNIKESRILFYGQKKHPLIDDKKSICIHFQCKSSNIREDIKNILKGYKTLGIVEFFLDFAITYAEEYTLCDVIIFGLRAVNEGRSNHITKKSVANCNKYKGEFNLEKIDIDPSSISEIIQSQAMQGAVALGNSIKEHHQVQISTCNLDVIDTEAFSNKSFGFGHKNLIITNAHVVEKGQLVRFHKTTKPTTSLKGYNMARTEFKDPVRDIAFLRILNKDEARAISGRPLYRLSPLDIKFGDLSKHLYSKEDWSKVVDNTSVMVNFPKSDINVPAIARCREKKMRRFANNESGERDLIEISGFIVEASFSKPGDCGGYIIATNDRYDTKMIGFHAASGNNAWFGALITKEDLRELRIEHECSDPWARLIVPGKPTDLPNGEEVEFIGKYKGTSMPVSSESLEHWRKSPWFDQFDEQLQPSPLGGADERIKVKLPINKDGKPSLLIAQNSIMCKKLPEMEQYILDTIEQSMVDELCCKLHGNLKTTTEDFDDLLTNAVNGARDNLFVTNLTLNKAAGLPWASIPKGALKSDYLEMIDNKIRFNNQLGQVLKKRVIFKLQQAKLGKRVISLSNSKVKDALIKKSAVEIGKVRVFHSIPVDKIIADSALFGNFKESFQKLFINANHAIGVNPHSKGWGLIYEKITQHPNFFDCDFENYDKHLHKELMQTVFNIIIKTIERVAPDNWKEARKILARESIETFVVDYDTVYKTERGNKSGEFLTTIVNCIANDILSFYAWIKNTGNSSIEVFRDNVSIVSFGDDKIESVSDEFVEQYNYMTVKEVLTEIGHKITPGSKDGKERPITSIDNLQFIKRSFVEQSGEIVAPLLKRSIESPFTWTQLECTDLLIWEGVVKEKLYEAYLWGRDYYEEFRMKLMKCNSEPLRLRLAPMLAVSYEECDYWTNCFKYE